VVQELCLPGCAFAFDFDTEWFRWGIRSIPPSGSPGNKTRHQCAQDTSYFEQVSLPFGTALNAESTGSTNRRFTSYDRSSSTGLDYAVNRHYDSQQGRFTQVDPIGMKASTLVDPQSLNLYSYVGNDPVNHMDPDGLFSRKSFFKALLLIHTFGLAGLLGFKSVRHPYCRSGCLKNTQQPMGQNRSIHRKLLSALCRAGSGSYTSSRAGYLQYSGGYRTDIAAYGYAIAASLQAVHCHCRDGPGKLGDLDDRGPGDTRCGKG
jgi:RHS repeat-associated protein